MKHNVHPDGKQIDEFGITRWYQNGVLHRKDGPAVIEDTHTKHWYQCGKKHRIDGPAIEWYDGDKWYYIMGTRYQYYVWLEKRKPFLIQENLNTVL